MTEEHVFKRSSVGGFNRADVMSYIEQRENELSAQKAKAEELQAKIGELEGRLSEQSRENEDRIKELESENEKLRAELEAKTEELKSESEEAKIGKAIIDVRRYSDELLHETTDKINAAAEETDKVVSSTLARLDNMRDELETFGSRLGAEFDNLISDCDDLSGDLKRKTGSLRLNFKAVAKKLNAEDD